MKLEKIMQFAVGLLLSAVVNVLTLPIMAWFYSKEVVGKFAMLNVVVAFIVTLFTLGLDQAFVREYHESRNKKNTFHESLFPGLALLIITLALVNIIDRGFISRLVFGMEDNAISMTISLIFVASYLNRFTSLIFRMEERGVFYSLSQALPKLVFLCLLFALYMLNNSAIEFLLTSQAISVFLVSIASVWLSRSFIFIIPNVKKDNVFEMLRYSIPLVFGALAFWGLSTIDRVFIAKFNSYNELAIFSIAMSFAGAANVIQSIFSTVWVPIVYKWTSKIDNEKECYSKIEAVKEAVSMISFILISLSALLSWLLVYILPEGYLDVVYIIPSCMIGVLYYTISETTVVGLSVVRKTSYSMASSIIAFIVNCIANFLLVPSLGAKGAAIATSISFLLFLILRTEFSSYCWVKINRFKLYLFSAVSLILSTLFCLHGQDYTFLFIFIWFAYIGIVLVAYFDSMKSAFSKFATYFVLIVILNCYPTI